MSHGPMNHTDATIDLDTVSADELELRCALGIKVSVPFELGHHKPQDYQSLWMHREAVRMILAEDTLAEKTLAVLARWDTHVSTSSKPLRDTWVEIITKRDWAKALEVSERGNQLRQASPLGTILPNEVRLGIIRKMRVLKDLAGQGPG
jgi:hypothetical protein